MIVYKVNDGLYVNMTNRCSNSCDFCVRTTVDKYYGDLWLDREPDVEEIKNAVFSALESGVKYSELVFCGYGEPTFRFDDIIKVCSAVKKSYSRLPIRINTNGQGNLINGRNITPEMKGLVDTVSISLNAADEKAYQSVCHSVFGEKAYAALIEFAVLSKSYVNKVILSVVDKTISDEDIQKCREIAQNCNVSLRVREFIE